MTAIIAHYNSDKIIYKKTFDELLEAARDSFEISLKRSDSGPLLREVLSKGEEGKKIFIIAIKEPLQRYTDFNIKDSRSLSIIEKTPILQEVGQAVAEEFERKLNK